MCRLTVYKGRPFLIGDLVVRPENGLLFQSRDATWHPGVTDGMGKRNIRVNADGFGVAWYSRESIDSDGYEHLLEETKNDCNAAASIYGLRAYVYESCVFKFVTPAWSNKNLRNIGDHVRSNLICAHVRAGSNGLNPDETFRVTVTEENCHPFQYHQWTFMHNGGIPNFENIKFPLIQLLDEMCWHGIAGNTDSEHIFALFLALLPDRDDPNVELGVFISSVEKTIACILQLCEKHNGVGSSFCCSLNLVFTDGCHIVATRYRTPHCNGNAEPPSLYYNWGNNFVCEEGQLKMQGESENGIPSKANDLIISSAPLSNSGELVLDTHTPNCAEYPTEMVFGRSDTLDSLDGSPKRKRGDSWYRDPRCTSRNSEVEGGYGHMGQWVLMPKNHMLVCIGNEDDPNSVEEVFLQDINDLQDVHGDVMGQQSQRKSAMDSEFKARYKERVKRMALQRKEQLQRRKMYFQHTHGMLETNLQTVNDDSTENSPIVASDRPERSSSPLPIIKVATVTRSDIARKLPTSPLKQQRRQFTSAPSRSRGNSGPLPSTSSPYNSAAADKDVESFYSRLLSVVLPPPADNVGGNVIDEDEYIVLSRRSLWRAALVGGMVLIALQISRRGH